MTRHLHSWLGAALIVAGYVGAAYLDREPAKAPEITSQELAP